MNCAVCENDNDGEGTYGYYPKLSKTDYVLICGRCLKKWLHENNLPTLKMRKYAEEINKRFNLKRDIAHMNYEDCKKFIGNYALAMRLPSAAHLKAMCAGSDDDFISLSTLERE